MINTHALCVCHLAIRMTLSFRMYLVRIVMTTFRYGYLISGRARVEFFFSKELLIGIAFFCKGVTKSRHVIKDPLSAGVTTYKVKL